MLQLIRGTVGTWIVKGLFVVLIISFGIWGIGDIFRGKSQSTAVAEVGPIKISMGELDHEVRQQINRLRPMFGGQLDIEQAKQLGLIDQTLDRMVQNNLLNLAVGDAGLNTGVDLVKFRLQRIPGFRNEQGQFDPELLRRILASNGMSEGTLFSMIREETGRELLSGAVTAGAAAPELMVDALYRYRNEKRVAETLTLANSSMPEPTAPDQAELTRYYEDKSVRYTAPEYRGMTIGLVRAADLAKTIELTENEIKTAFDSRADEFQLPERRSFQQVVVDSEDKARAVAEKARAAKLDLDAAAKAEGLDVTALGPVAEADLPEIGVSIFALEVGAIPDPFKSDLGWHVVKVTKIEPARVRKLADVRDEVVAAAQAERASETMPRFINMIEDALAGGATMEEAAAKYRFPLTKIDQVESSGAKPDGSKVSDIPDLSLILQTAYTLGKGARSSVVDAAENNAFVVRVDSLIPSQLRPLAEVHDRVLADWKVEQRTKAAAKMAEEIEAKLKAGDSIEALAKTTSAIAATTEPLVRNPGRSGGPLPPDLLKQIFSALPGDVARSASADGQIIAKLKNIIPADPKAANSPLAGLRDAEQHTLSDDLMAQFTAGLRMRWPVSINRERIDQMFSSN
ncbi:MAG: peptidyl-prolyl cis-trans isomerase [Rhodospirillaceae bacterium]